MRRSLRIALVAFIVALTFTLWAGSALASEECLVCHGQAGFSTIIEGKKVSLYVNAKRYSESVHKNVACTGCHLGFGPGPHGDKAMAEYSKIASGACEKCHGGAYNRYIKGSHYSAYKEKKPKAPTCVTCHGNHYTLGFKEAESPTSYLEAPEKLCGKCHHEALETYLEGYHGKTLVTLGYKKSASCSKCHDAHLADNLDSKERAIAACRQCHPGANENFVGYLVHADENDRVGEPLLFYVKWIMTILLIGVLGFFYGHTFLWAYRDTVERRRKGKRGEGH